MSKNRKIRNAKRTSAIICREVPLQRAHLKVGEVVQYGDWLFALRADGSLATDLGCGIDRLRNYYKKSYPVDHKHWFATNRVATRRPNLKL